MKNERNRQHNVAAPGVMTMSGSSVAGIPLPAGGPGGPFGGGKNYWRRHHCFHHQFRRQYCHLLVSHCFLVALFHCLQHYFFGLGIQLKLETSNAYCTASKNTLSLPRLCLYFNTPNNR